jgi:transcriptional regulator with GAF, ATPase, and Fis domain/Tfp pilus assembly protein PilF
MSKPHGGEPTGKDEQPRGPGGAAASLEDLGDFCLASGEFSTAIEYFTKLLTVTGNTDEVKPRRASFLRRLAVCYMRVGKCDHALELLDKAFMLVSEGEDPVELARIISDRAWVHFKIGEYDLSQADCESALDIMLGEGRGKEQVDVYNCLAGVCARKGETDKATEFLRSALSVARLMNDRELVGVCLNNLGLSCKNLGRWAEAQAYLEEALQIAEEVGQHLQKGGRLANLGIVYAKRGYWKKAHRCWVEALEVLTRIGNRWELVSVYLAMGHYYLTYRDFERAQQYYVLAMKEASDNGDARGSALSFEYMGDVEMATGDVAAADRYYRQAMEIAEEIAPEGDVVVEVLRRLADVETARGNYQTGVEYASRAAKLAAGIKEIFEQGCSLRSKACAEFRLGEWEKARSDFAKAISLLASIGEKKELGLTYLAAGNLLSSHSASIEVATEYFSQALSIFDELEMNYESGAAAIALGRVFAGRGDALGCRGYLDRVAEIFGGNVPPGFAEAVRAIEREADEQISCLSVSDSSELSAFNGIVARILAAEGRTSKLQLALDACIERTPAARGMILVRREALLEPLASRDFEAHDACLAVPGIEAMLKAAEQADRPQVVTTIERDSAVDALAKGILRGAAMCVPIALGGQSAGCVYLDTNASAGPFTRNDVELVVAIVGILKSVLSEAKLRSLMEETKLLRGKLETASNYQGIIGRNKRMLEILESIGFLGKSLTTVLVEGETGTGKEVLARAIHLSGDRKAKPFVTIDCSALSTEVVESELFGHVKGAFTDARADRAGLFEAAEGGTVFLDEIDKTSRKFQERLLQVVDKHEFKPVGSTVSRRTDFRLVCATNRDLAREVEAGRFLEDLYYRLKVISLKVPPLRERRDDIPLLAEHFLDKYADQMHKAVAGFAPPAMDLLVSYSWPGNVRQLEHEVERAVTFVESGEAVMPALFSDELRGWASVVSSGAGHGLSETIEQVERQVIGDALRRFKGNKSKAARNLGLSRRGLLNKLHRYGIVS